MANIDTHPSAQAPAAPGGATPHPVCQQGLRILHCTAKAMASTPGGLRFKAGTRPWLEGLENITRGRAYQALPAIGEAA